MAQIQITVEDSLGEIVDDAIYEVKAELESYLAEEKPDTMPDWSDLDYSGRMHEIIDSAVPVYTQEQKDLWFLYGDEAEEIFESQFGAEAKVDQDGWPMGWKAAALFSLIESRVQDWWHVEAKEIFEDWLEKQEDDEDESD